MSRKNKKQKYRELHKKALEKAKLDEKPTQLAAQEESEAEEKEESQGGMVIESVRRKKIKKNKLFSRQALL